MISLRDYITSGGKYPHAWDEFHALPNAEDLLKWARITIARASLCCHMAGIKNPQVTSGWRSPSHNKAIGGAPKSKHLHAQAVDIADPDKTLGAWCVANVGELKEIGVWIESLVVTHKAAEPSGRWVHIAVVAPPSGNRIFIP